MDWEQQAAAGEGDVGAVQGREAMGRVAEVACGAAAGSGLGVRCRTERALISGPTGGRKGRRRQPSIPLHACRAAPATHRHFGCRMRCELAWCEGSRGELAAC